MRCNDSMCADAIEAFHVSVVDAKRWRLLQINATDTFTMLLDLSFCQCRIFLVQLWGLPSFPRSPISAMTPCVEVVLSWAIGGGDIHRWHGVSFNYFLAMSWLPGQVEVVHGQKSALIVRHTLPKQDAQKLHAALCLPRVSNPLRRPQ